MSSIGFLTIDGERRVSGREHGKLRLLADRLAWLAAQEAFPLDTPAGVDLMRRAVAWPDHLVNDPLGRPFEERIEFYIGSPGWNISAVSPTCPDPLNLLELGLNSIVAEYGDVLTLAARIVSQCQVNAWIAGEDRGWLADLIAAGLTTPYPPAAFDEDWPPPATTVFSDGEHWKTHYDGWASVAEMLRADDRGMVVLDYSVTDGFPDISWAAWPDDPDKEFRERWENTDVDERWQASARGLRRRTDMECPLLRISPTNLHAASFARHEAWTWRTLAGVWRAHDRIAV